jgi:putative acetyltransferase
MIRKFQKEDLDRVMEIWLNTNIQAHKFIPKEYWMSNFNMVKRALPLAEIYVYESQNKIEAFIGIENGYIAGIFVSSEMQSKGIGKRLLEKSKQLYADLKLSVYEKNSRAILFYLREGFEIEKKQIDERTGEAEFLMLWKKHES